MSSSPLSVPMRPGTSCRATEDAGTGRGKRVRTSLFRGVTKHRWSGRYEAHVWDKDGWNKAQTKKGRQMYLGAFGDEVAAARTHDLAAIKLWGLTTILNFPAATYVEECKEMARMSKSEYIAMLRRRSSGFARGASKYRGVARHHQKGRWEARIGRFMGDKYFYLGTFSTEVAAAEAYDLAAIQLKGANAVTNFPSSHYQLQLRLRPQQPAPKPCPSLEDMPLDEEVDEFFDNEPYQEDAESTIAGSGERTGAEGDEEDVSTLSP